MRFFNTSGPVDASRHYTLPPLSRLDWAEVELLIEQQRYFVLHAPRQTGKTSTLLALMERLNGEGRYRCCYANIEAAQAAREDVFEAIRAVLSVMASSAEIYLQDRTLADCWPDVLRRSGPYDAMRQSLLHWAQADPRPLVLLLDEIDALMGDSLIAVLRQLRAGYAQRPRHFPATVILCGVRDVRDYRIRSSRDNAIVTGGSAFNIKAESLRLGNFSEAEMRQLLAQHTAETGQVFQKQALEAFWQLTRGQPWLVNALAYQVCFKMPGGRERSRNIDLALVTEAKEQLILRRDTHLDQLADKLQEERVRRVIAPLLAGSEQQQEDFRPDDVGYVRDLGLIQVAPNGRVEIANAIYREIIPRELNYGAQLTITQETAWYQRPDGSLDLDKLLSAFQAFFREHSEHWIERFDYKEAGPQLLLQAFLQRIVNGGGRIEREYGLGRRRTDLLVVWPQVQPEQRMVLELKIVHKGREATVREGLAQIVEYLERCGSQEGHLVLFDRDPERPWSEKLFRGEEGYKGYKVRVWGM
ncbi:MAG: ATP-binding protein [Candidatus Competibacteraceae bacterium]|nr:ATP-binding protein [Candidatus Competibacteraceae bacterium]